MTIQRLHVGPRLSEMVIHQGTIYLAGQVPADTTLDARGQAAQVFGDIETLLLEAGSDKTRLLSCTIYLPDLGDYDAMNQAWDAWVAQGHTPARATVQARLANPAWKIEVVVTAAV